MCKHAFAIAKQIYKYNMIMFRKFIVSRLQYRPIRIEGAVEIEYRYKQNEKKNNTTLSEQIQTFKFFRERLTSA